jgi:hypothetical protein
MAGASMLCGLRATPVDWKGKDFFLERKKQRTFVRLPHADRSAPRTPLKIKSLFDFCRLSDFIP